MDILINELSLDGQYSTVNEFLSEGLSAFINVLDEISVAEGIRAQNIARTAYRVSNRRKLQDHLELTRNEIICYQTGQNIESYYDDSDVPFFLAW